MSLGVFKTPYETSVTADVHTKWFNLTAKRSTPNSSYVVLTRKTNYIPYSESFNNTFWNRNSVYLSNPVQNMSGLLPYRNTKLDADQVTQIFYATSNNITANNYYNNYYQTQWYNLAPLNRRKAFVANIQEVIYDVPGTPDKHYIQSNVNFESTETNDQYFSMSVYVSSSTANFRLDVGNFGQVYCDFNLNLGTVITSVGTIYNRIRMVDTAQGVYLCQIIGPIRTNNLFNINYHTSTFIRVRVNDSFTPSEYLKPASRTFRTLNDTSTSTEILTNYLGSDLLVGSSILDAVSGSGSEDYLISP
jgi:hypothetical protein